MPARTRWIYLAMTVKYIIRHSCMRFLGEFEAAEGISFGRGQQVVVRSDRGHEIGEVLCEANPRAVELLSEPTHGQILRVLSEQDRIQADGLPQAEQRAFE